MELRNGLRRIGTDNEQERNYEPVCESNEKRILQNETGSVTVLRQAQDGSGCSLLRINHVLLCFLLFLS